MPAGHESSLFFTYRFLHWLLWELQVLVTDIDHMDRRVLVDKADQLRDYYAKHSHGTVAVVNKPSSDDEGFPVAVLCCQATGNRQVGSKGCMKKKVVSLASGPSAGRQQQAPHTGCAGTTSEPGGDCRLPCIWSADN